MREKSKAAQAFAAAIRGWAFSDKAAMQKRYDDGRKAIAAITDRMEYQDAHDRLEAIKVALAKEWGKRK